MLVPSRTLCLSLVCLWGLSLLPLTAHADDTSVGKAHFKRGVSFYKKARYREAIEEFEAAYKAKPHGVLFFNIAQAYEKLGDIASALRNYHAYLRAVPNADDRTEVEAAMKNLEQRLGAKGVQELLVDSEPSKSDVTIDDQPAGKTPYTGEIALGEHHVKISHEGYQPRERTVTLNADSSLEMDVTLELALTQPPPPPPTPEPAATAVSEPPTPKPAPSTEPAPAPAATQVTEKAAPPSSKFGPWKYVAAGAAAVALTVAIIEGVNAQSASNQLLQGPPKSGAVATSLRDSALYQSQAANLLYVVAAGVGAGAGVMFAVEGHF